MNRKTRYVLHEIFRIVSRFLRYISCCSISRKIDYFWDSVNRTNIKFLQTLQLHCTLSFRLIDRKKTHQASYGMCLSFLQIKQIQSILNISDSTTLYVKKVCWEATFLIPVHWMGHALSKNLKLFYLSFKTGGRWQLVGVCSFVLEKSAKFFLPINIRCLKK